MKPCVAIAVALAACSSPHPRRGRDLALHDRISRDELIRFAVRTNQPLFWVADTNHDQRVEPDEIASLLLYPSTPRWVENGAFTPAFEAAYDQIVAARRDEAPGGDDFVPDPPDDPGGRARRHSISAELDFGRTALVPADVPRDALPFVRKIVAAATLVDGAHAQLVAGDLVSQSLVRRNRAPACIAPPYRNDPKCSAAPRASLAAFVAAATATRQPDHAAIATELAAAAGVLVDPADAVLAAALRSFPSSATTTSWYFHATPDGLTLGRVDPRSREWQAKLAPRHLPELVDVIVAAGTDREPLGGTLAQHGVVLANLYADPDSRESRRDLGATLLDSASMRDFTDNSDPWLLAAMLREAAAGSPFVEIAALRDVERLRVAGTISDELARETATAMLFDLLGRARELYDARGVRVPGDSSVATAIGELCDHGVLVWDGAALSANGATGTFAVHLDKLVSACDALLDADPSAMLAHYRGESGSPFGIVSYRVQMSRSISFVYAEVP